MKYKVIWFDDKYATLPRILEQAILNDIELIGFTNAEEGIVELENNIELYDGAILDGIFYKSANDEGDAYDDEPMGDVAKKLLQLEYRKKLPWFILSGKQSFKKEKNRFAEAYKEGKVYDKLGDNLHLKELWDNLKKESDELPITQLKNKYPNQFEICSDNYIGKKHFDRVLNLVQNIENPTEIKIAEDSLTPIRKIIEAIFNKLNHIGCIPDDIIQENGWISKASRFLSNRDNNYSHKQEIVHPVIAETIFRILTLTQDASHNEGSKLGVDTYLSQSNNTYLYQSCVYALLDILDWLKPFIDNNSDKNNNLRKWKTVQNTPTPDHNQWISGKVLKKSDNGWATFIQDNSSNQISIIPAMVTKFNLEENQPIEIKTEPSPCGTKTFIKDIRVKN